MYTYLSMDRSVYLSIYLSIHPSICLSIYLSYICIYMSVILPTGLLLVGLALGYHRGCKQES